MAISLLGSLQPKQTTYSSLAPVQKNYSSLSNPAPAPIPNATSVTTKQPVVGSVTPVNTSLGVKAVSPTTSTPAPQTVLPKAQVQPVVSAPVGNASNGYQDNPFGVTEAQKQAGLLAQAQANSKTPPTTGPGSPDPTLNNGQNPLSQTNGAAPVYNANNPISYGGLLTQAANVASQPSTDYLNQQANARQYQDMLAKSRLNEAQGLADNANNPIPLTFQQGRAQVLQSQYEQEQAALGSAFQGASTLTGAANTQQGLQQTGLLSAAAAAAPVTQFGQLTSPITGQVVSPSGGNPQLNNAVNQAVNLIRNGSSINDAVAASGLGAFGVPGTQALTAAMGGGYNPTQINAGAQQNASQATDTQGQAFQMDTALKQLNTVTPMVNSFLTQSGLNSQDNPSFNKALNTYYGQFLSPGNKQIFETYMGDIKKYTSQILAAGTGTIPTDIANTLASFDPSNLTASQLQPYLDSLKKLGDNQLSVLQGQHSATGGTGYSGTPTQVDQNPIVAPTINPSGVTSDNPVIQGMIGGVLNIPGAAGSFLSHVFSAL